MDEPEIDVNKTYEVPGLMFACMEQMSRDAEFTTNALLDSYKHQAEKAQATLDLVRDRISELLSGPYMPTSHALANALWPLEAEIEAEMKAPSSV